MLLLLLLFVVNSCRDSQRENALKDYNRQISAIGDESSRAVAQPFFQLLTEGAGDSPQDLQTNISGYRVQAEQQYEQAAQLDVPSEMRGAQQAALIALEWRRDGLDKIAQQIRNALGDEGEAADAAINSIAGQMAVFAASDVAWDTRVIPFIQNALDENEIGGQSDQALAVPAGHPLDAARDRRAGARPAAHERRRHRRRRSRPAPGLHGTGLDATSYGDTTLQPGVTNRLTYAPNQPFAVKFTNQGENDEFDIKVTLRIQSEGGQPITTSKTVPKLAPQESATVELAPTKQPPIGTAVTIRVMVAKVPGEEKTDNNRSEYPALFERG